MQKTAMNEKDILRRHAAHAYELTDADRAEILAAFAADPAVCFEVTKEAASHRRDCFRAVWEHNPDALILDEVDLCHWGKESVIRRDQCLIINKGGDKRSTDKILELLESAGLTDRALVCYTPKDGGEKHCYEEVFGSTKPSLTHIVRLHDDGNLLLSIRTAVKQKSTAESGD